MHCCTEVTGETEPMPACSRQWFPIRFVYTRQHVSNTCAHALARLEQQATANALSRSRSPTTEAGIPPPPPQQQTLLHSGVRGERRMQPLLLTH